MVKKSLKTSYEGGVALLDIKIAQFWWITIKRTDEWTRRGSRNPNVYGDLENDKKDISNLSPKGKCSLSVILGQNAHFTPYTKIHSRWSKDVDIKIKSYNF